MSRVSRSQGNGVAMELMGVEKRSKFSASTGGKLPTNLDFLFRCRLYFEHGECACLSGIQGVK